MLHALGAALLQLVNPWFAAVVVVALVVLVLGRNRKLSIEAAWSVYGRRGLKKRGEIHIGGDPFKQRDGYYEVEMQDGRRIHMTESQDAEAHTNRKRQPTDEDQRVS